MAYATRPLTPVFAPKLSPLWAELLKRLPLCAAAVAICYRFEWMWLRFVTSEATLRFVEWRGFEAVRLSPHAIAWNGKHFEFGIACTFADVFCGALPLLWVRRAGLLRNAGFIAAFAVGLFAFNLLRQSAADLLFGAGVPWTFADNAVGALSYFVVWVFLVCWLERTASITRLTASTASLVSP